MLPTVPPPARPAPARPPEDAASVRAMFARIAGRYDLANTVLSGGLDAWWRRRAAGLVRTWAPDRLLDLATGSGALAATLRGVCPATRIVGADFCVPMLRECPRLLKRAAHLRVAADGLRLPFADAAFDALTVSFGLRNMASWPDALREAARVLRPGGHLLVLDFSLPSRPWLRAAYRLYLHHVLPRLAALVCGERRAYDYLGASIESFPRGGEMVRLIGSCGFGNATAEELTGGIVSLYTAVRQSG